MNKLQFFKKKETTLRQILPECLNCGKPLASDDVFCSYCGQKNIEKLNFGSFIGQLISGFFSYDSRFWTTFMPLLFKPGSVSKNYIAGKRKRYVNPFQLYLQVSILFFLILGFTSDWDNIIPTADIPESQQVLDSILTDDVKTQIFKEMDTVDQRVITSFSDGIQFSDMLIDSTYQYKIQNDTIKEISFTNKIQDFYVYQHRHRNEGFTETRLALTEIGYPTTFWNRFYFEQVQRYRKSYKEITESRGKGFIKKIIAKLSIALFIFLPLFTLFFKLIYYRKHMNYMEHLVFVFHTQTVFFLLMIIYILINYFTGYENIGLFMFLFLIYLFMALKKFYQQGKLKTFVKFILLNIVYTTIGFFAAIISGFIAFMFG